MRYRLRTLLIVLALGPPLLAYVSSYFVLSRQGYAVSDALGVKGFYFVPYDTLEEKNTNDRYRRLYRALIDLELFLGTGRTPAGDPMWAGDGPPWEVRREPATLDEP